MLGKKSGKHVVKKTTAVVLAAAVLGTAVPVCSPQETMAASKVSIAALKKLKVGQSYQLKLKNAVDWTVQGVKTENKKIVKITKQSKKAVTVSAVRAGWCNVTVRAKNNENGKTKKLKCRIQVTSGVKREVFTQAQLNAALKKKDTEQITINNITQETSYQIPAGTYSNVALIVKAGGAKVTNNGTFGSVTIQSAKKGGGWTENAKGNSLRVTSTVSKIVVNKGAKVANLSLEKAGTDTQLEIKGKVSKVIVNGANTKLAISGSTASVVPITVKKAASGSEITASIQVNATVKAKKVQITLNKGAEESTIKAIKVRTGIVNNADGNVTVTDGNGTAVLAPGMEMTTVVLSGSVDTEGKNEDEVKILQSIIKEQNTKGAHLPEDLDGGKYTWENGQLTRIDWTACGLTGKLDLSSLSSLTSLQKLNCYFNQLTSLDVSGLTSLQELDCTSNQLTSLNVSGLTSLQELDCYANQLTSLDVSGLNSLEHLRCIFNQLTSLDVSGLTSMQGLYCGTNKLTSLDVSGLISLQELDCGNNQLTSLDVSGLISLQELDCDGNQLTSLNVSSLTSLQKLDCESNQLTSLDVSGLISLQKLDCDDNQLTSLDVSGLTSLQGLYCYNNQLMSLDLSGLTSMQELCCESNQLAELNVSGLNSLKNLRCDDNVTVIGRQ